MPIIDYTQKAQTSKKRLFDNPDITDTNKKYVKDFLKAYTVSDARKDVFFTHITFFLERSRDAKKEMKDYQKVNTIFKDIRKFKNSEGKPLSLSTYATIINTTLLFVKWLNHAMKPLGFKDIKSPKKKLLKRKLKPSDMISWDEGLMIAKELKTIQLKAILMVQLDGGFRPSELIDLTYGDIKKEGRIITAHVGRSKTGDSRDVFLYKSVPYLMKWLSEHPSKNPKDPLWIMEYHLNSSRKNIKGKILPYSYPAIRKQIVSAASRANINKPVDFYNLRHSAIVICKNENIGIDIATDRFGHSAEYYLNTYGRLTTKDKQNKFIKHIGEGLDEDNDKKLTVTCQICEHINPPNSEVCSKCMNPLTVQKALELKSEKDKEIDKLKSEMQRFKEQMLDMFEKKLKTKN